MHGYGQLPTGGLAHRAAYEKAYGPIPKGLLVRHKCDVRACVNPEHLELGTAADNSQDMVNRGRHAHACGTQISKSGLTDEIVRSIKQSAEPNTHIADRLGVSTSAIQNIRAGRTWRHVK